MFRPGGPPGPAQLQRMVHALLGSADRGARGVQAYPDAVRWGSWTWKPTA